MSKNFNQPLSGNDMPRYAGPGTMFRLPQQANAKGLDVAIAGVGLDIGTSNRTGTRFGPRQIRNESAMVRPYCMATAAAPFDSFQIADVGDVALNSFDLLKSIDIIESFYDDLLTVSRLCFCPGYQFAGISTQAHRPAHVNYTVLIRH